MIWRAAKLVTFGVIVRKIARNPVVAKPARGLFRRFAHRREAGRWHDVPPPGGPPEEPPGGPSQ